MNVKLQDIMQLVVVDVIGVERPGVVGATFGVVVCASAALHATISGAARMIAKARMAISPTLRHP
jgi:hypothetical protein